MVTCAHAGPRRVAMSDADDVEEANARFYRAFETLDISEMERVWIHAEHARCVHPGWELVIGLTEEPQRTSPAIHARASTMPCAQSD